MSEITTTPVVLSYGLGADSTAILLRWIEEPESRDFELKDLVVITAMTGDEFPDTDRLVTEHILPRMREHGIRFVQVARAGNKQEDGIIVLDDSRNPEKLHIKGVYRLSDEMLAAGTIPTTGGVRKCSQKQKGFPLDTWLHREFGTQPFRHVMGFNAEEMRRVEKDASYSTEVRQSEYPLVTWGWGRQMLEDYIASVVAEPWAKSCCTFCPFAGATAAGRERLAERWMQFPEAAADAVMMELAALALNPKMKLFLNHSAMDLVRDSGNEAAIRIIRERLEASEWSVYRVRRAFRAKGNAAREVSIVATATTEAQAEELFRGVVANEGATMGHNPFQRAWVRTRVAENVYPSAEEMLVVAPRIATEKASPGFAKAWDKALAA